VDKNTYPRIERDIETLGVIYAREVFLKVSCTRSLSSFSTLFVELDRCVNHDKKSSNLLLRNHLRGKNQLNSNCENSRYQQNVANVENTFALLSTIIQHLQHVFKFNDLAYKLRAHELCTSSVILYMFY